jgi:DNA-binding winged helix-turn-helix (wHTH) protein/tetratricopeptide (TPR) repeat protein
MSFEANGDVEKYQFEIFELFPKQRTLWRDGERLSLMPKPLETLIMLVEHAGQTVSKETLLEQVWKGAVVEENNLTQSISTLRKALGEKRGENRFIVTDPGRGYRFVAPVWRIIEAAAAPAPAVPEATTLDAALGDQPVVAFRRRNAVSSWMAGGAALLLALGLGAAHWLTKRGTVSPPVRRSVAVLRLRDLSEPGEAWLQTALTEMLTSELAAGGQLRTIPAEDVERWRSDPAVAADHAKQSDLLRAAQRYLGADSLIVGSYLATGNCPDCRVRVDLGLMNSGTGERLATVIEEGAAADLTGLTSRLGRRLRSEFGVTATIASSPQWPRASAMREYAEGLKALRGGDPVSSREHLQAAAEADPENPLIHSALAEAWNALGYGARTKEENRRAFELSGSLDRLNRLGVEARYRTSMLQWDRTIEIYQTIFKLFPDSLEDGLNLARAQMQAKRHADAKFTLNALRRLPAPAGTDPRIDMVDARMAGIQDDYQRTRDLAHRAAEEARARGAHYLYGRARLLEGGALQNVAKTDSGLKAAIDAQTEARQVCEQAGDRLCVSQSWRIEGNRLYYYGDFAGAVRAYTNGVAITRELGNREELSNLLQGYAVIAEADRKWADAEKHLQEAVALRVETGLDPSGVQVQLAELFVFLGRTSDAGRILESARLAASQSNAHESLGEVSQMQSVVARSKGELDRAQQFADVSVVELRFTQNPVLLAAALANASSIATLRGDLQTAEKDLASAVVDKVTPEVDGVVRSARAELYLAKDRLVDAAAEARRSAEALDKAHADQESARALLITADALELLHREDQARQACSDAEARARRGPNPIPIALVRLCEWRLNRIAGEPRPREPGVANSELALIADYSSAMRCRREGSGDSRSLFERLARTASARGYMTLSKRALSLANATVSSKRR